MPARSLQALSRTLAAVEHSGYSHTVRERFESIPDVFHGASIQVADGVSIEDLQKIEGVKVRSAPRDGAV